MKTYLIWICLAVIAMTFSVLEGVVRNIPEQFVQLNGLLTILSVLAVITWTLKIQIGGDSKQ